MRSAAGVRATAVLVAGVLATVLFVAAFAFPPKASATALPPQLRVPLATAVTTPAGSWAVVAMGHLSDPLNTFWELFFLAPGASRWSLVTPPGVADNGGLVAGVPFFGPVAIGFEPSQQLHYSPLALSSDGGAHWTPALMPTALSAAPDALAYEPAGPAVPGRALALVRTLGGQVLAGPASLIGWAPLVSGRALMALAGRSCGIEGLDAVAFGPGGGPMVGTGCRRPGQVGIFTLQGGLWRQTGPTLSAPLAGSPTEMLRLDVSGSAITGLVADSNGAGSRLLAVWRHGGGSWSASAPLPIGPSQTLLSTAFGVGGELAVLVAGPGKNRTPEEVAPGRPWIRLPLLPPGTTTVAPMGNGSIDAFDVHGSHLRVYTLAAGANTWISSQSMDVPIAYGSS